MLIAYAFAGRKMQIYTRIHSNIKCKFNFIFTCVPPPPRPPQRASPKAFLEGGGVSVLACHIFFKFEVEIRRLRSRGSYLSGGKEIRRSPTSLRSDDVTGNILMTDDKKTVVAKIINSRS